MGIVWERLSRSPEGSRKGCRCIPLPDLLRQISCKSICVPRLGLSVVCAAQTPRSSPCQAGVAEQCGNVSKDTQAVIDLQRAPVPLAATAPLLWGWAGL